MVDRHRRRDENEGQQRGREPRWESGSRGGGGRPGGGRPDRGGPPGGGRAGRRPWVDERGEGAGPRRQEGRREPPAERGAGPRRDWSPRPQRNRAEWRDDRPPQRRSPDEQTDDRASRPRPAPWSDRPRRDGPPSYGRPRPPFRDAARPEQRIPVRPPTPDLLQQGEELVAGRRPVEEAFAARRQAQRLLVVPERRAALDALVLHATTLRIPVVEVEGGTLTSLAGFDGHQGVALALSARPRAGLDDVLARARERSEAVFVLVLDSLEDPQNLGTLLRSAEACGVHGVIFPTRRSAPLSPSAIKASAGATEHLLLVPVDDLAGTLADLRSRGLRLIGADEGAPLRYGEADLRGPLALVVGSEERGISGALRRRLDLAVRIPMRGRIASLNAAVAGSVLLFAAADQRGRAESGEEPGSAPDEPNEPVEPTAPSAEAEPGQKTPPRSRAGRTAKRERDKAGDGGDDSTETPPMEADENGVLPDEAGSQE
jgi:23S rRNA (guanosine2251-2'-O)-methyltransferase